MMKTKLLSMLALFAFMTSVTSCADNADQAQALNQPDQVQTLAPQQSSPAESEPIAMAADNKEATAATSINVYEGKSVIPQAKGSAIDFTWEENGKIKKFSEFAKGKLVVLNFWGTWCPPCRRELPDLVAIHKEMESQGVIVFGVSLERDRNPESRMKNVKRFIQAQGIPYHDVVFADDKLLQQVIDHYGGFGGVPTTLFINKDGKVMEKISGMLSKAQFMSIINKYK